MTKSFDERVEERVIEELEAVDMNQLYDDMLDACYPEVQIGVCTFSPSRVLSELDPIAYRCGFSDWTDSVSDEYEEINGDYYRKEEVDAIRSEVEDEIETEAGNEEASE